MAAGSLSDRPPGWPAWCASLLLHAGLLTAVLLWLKPPIPLGAADQPQREVGIVLKLTTDDGPLFEGEDSTESDNAPNDSQQNDPLLAALPTPAEIPPTDAALPRLPTLGAEALQEAQAGSVTQLASGGTPSRRLGSKATVSVFGVEGTGSRFVYIFDRSDSMTGGPLRAAKQQLIASLDALDSVHQFQIIFFHHEPRAWDLTGGQQRIAFATDANKRQAEKFVGSITATGGTFRHTALQLGISMGPDVIFFLTDIDNPMSSDDLNAAIRRAQRSAIAINTIEYGSGAAQVGENFLVRLARETGGNYVYIDTQKLGR